MKKFVIAAAILMSSSMAIMSCDNGAYDADPGTNNNGVPPIGIPGGGGSGGGGGSFNWTGTDPMSAKIDGTPFQATGTGNYIEMSGFYIVSAGNAGTSILINFPSAPSANTVYSFNTTTSASMTEGSNSYTSNTAAGGSGAVKVLENDATHIKGYFYGVFKSPLGGGTKTVTDGYFNVTK